MSFLSRREPAARTALLITLFMWLPLRGLAQSHGTGTTFICGTPSTIAGTRQLDGTTFPSGNGKSAAPTILNALVLFIEFPDDDDPRGEPWPKGAPPMAMMTDIIDTGLTVQSGKKYNITTYYKDMSFGKFMVIGQPVWRKTRYSLAQYQSVITANAAVTAGHPEDANSLFAGNTRYWAFRHVMEDLDRELDFTPYDVGGNGFIDLIIVCWRNSGTYTVVKPGGAKEQRRDESFIGFDGKADLGGGAVFSLDNGRRKVRTETYSGSGITALNMLRYPSMGIIYHELGHMLGLTHQYSGGIWSPMGSGASSVSYCMNSFEREKLGWISPVEVTSHIQRETLADFATTGAACRIEVDKNTSFYIENHQCKKSPYISSLPTDRPWYDPADVYSYDVVDHATDGAPGLYILQVQAEEASVVCADGRWNWEVMPCPDATVIAPWSTTQKLLVWQRAAINRIGGETDRAFQKSFTSMCEEPPFTMNDFIWASRDHQRCTTVNNGIGKQRGDGKDRWLPGEIFSPWSNPSSRNASLETSVAVEVLYERMDLIDVRFYRSNPENGPPSKPQDLHVTMEPASDPFFYRPKLTWELNTEPDVNPNGEYLIYRFVESSWVYVATVAGDISTYTDTDYDFSRDSGGTVRYRIRAVDGLFKLSVPSDEAWLIIEPKQSGIDEGGAIVSSRLTAEHSPNPARAEVTITCRLEANGPLTIDVYDMRGGRVATLVDGFLPAGAHTVVFDGSDLERGIYTYVVRHNGESFTGKIVLE